MNIRHLNLISLVVAGAVISTGCFLTSPDDEAGQATEDAAVEKCSSRLFEQRPLDCIDFLSALQCLGEESIGTGNVGTDEQVERQLAVMWTVCVNTCANYSNTPRWYRDNCSQQADTADDRDKACTAYENGCYRTFEMIEGTLFDAVPLLRVFSPSQPIPGGTGNPNSPPPPPPPPPPPTPDF